MSASNWAQCPKCKADRQATADTAETYVLAAYGTVTIDEFDGLRAAAAQAKARVEQNESEYNFREDYEIYGAATGEVKVRYRGQCSLCKLSLTFEHTHELLAVSK